MKVVYYIWGHQLEEVAAQIQRLLDQRPGARVAALSHSAALVQEQVQLNVDTWDRLMGGGQRGRVAGSGVATLVYTVLLVLEDQ